jgi:MATE family multidrug resistance protein
LLAIFLNLFALIFIVFHQYLPALFVDMNNVADLAVNTEVVTTIATITSSRSNFPNIRWYSSCGIRCSSRATDVKIPMYITFVAYWVVGFPVSIYLGMYTDLKAAGIWIGLLAGLSTAALFLYIRFNILTKLILENQGAL